MSNLFSGMEIFGLEKISKDINIYANEEKKAKGDDNQQSMNQSAVKEEDLLFDKNLVCPVCDQNLKSKTVKTGKVKLLSMDMDLRPKYQHVDSLKYDAIVCPKCGYAALRRFFPMVTNVQCRLIKEKISVNFRGLPESGATYTYNEAINRHKLALLNTIVKKGKSSEKAYICLKIAWLYRGKAESLPEEMANREAQVKELKQYEDQFIKEAYEGFKDAYPKESFPICGMDELTCTYLIADLAIQAGDYAQAGRFISSLLVSRTANERIKNKARNLKEVLKKIKEV